MTSRKYKHPPIQEALVEFEFAEDTEWDFTAPATIYASLREEYPGKPLQQVAAGLEVDTADGNQGFKLQQGPPRVRFSSVESNRLAVVGQRYLSVHVTSEYPGWEQFKSQVQRAFSAYVAATEAVNLVKIGVRYVNRMEFPSEEVLLDNYFVNAPATPIGFDLGIVNFLTRVEMSQSPGNARVGRTFGSIDANPGSSAFILDLDVSERWDNPGLEVGKTQDVVERLRALERQVFESLITDDLRGMFDDD